MRKWWWYGAEAPAGSPRDPQAASKLRLFDGGDTEPPPALALNQRLKQALAQWPGLYLDERAFPGVSHGQMFPDGLATALPAYLR